MNNDSNFKIKFLGTAGARFVVTQQLRSSGGIWYNLDGTEFLLDPGPGTLVRALESNPKKNPADLDGIILSHRHIDHSNDLNIMVEAMTEGGRKKHGEIFLPQDALGSQEPILFNYLHKFVNNVHLLKEESSYKLQNLSFQTSPAHIHDTETFGFKFSTSHGTIAHLTDTKFFDELLNFYKVDILIMNLACLNHALTKDLIIKHLYCYPDAVNIIGELKPKLTVLTHFGMHMLRSDPMSIAKDLTQKTGCQILAAQDGMEIDLLNYW
ncbi:MBL fold metallo-hydrolase [Candidatus Poribacteria bacterium]|nr:MBL fold metallo-hydrolase [Candidatus Poribacteria bacterium]